jgi:hypothetical protein
VSEPLRPALKRPLPAEVALGRGRWLGYRRFPAFSRPWLWRRAVLFLAVILVFAVLQAVGLGARTDDWRLAMSAGLYGAFAFFAMSQIGPLLATLVRHAGWSLRLERLAVVAALATGVAVAFAVDHAASGWVEREVVPRLQEKGELPEQMPMPEVQGLSGGKLANLMVLALVYTALGGGLALRPYLSEPRRLAELARRRELEALRRNKHDADLRLSVLQAQVEPHFLFNTLASLRLLIREDPARAESVLDALVQHLRATIPQLRDGEAGVHSTLGQQLDICRGYLDLMRVRLGERLQIEVDVEAELRALPFPPLLLITLVENAIKHGVEPKRGTARIVIDARRTDSGLQVTVSDDGVGLTPGPSSGLGLANIREQLKARFGDRAQLLVDARARGGTRAALHIPLEEVA